MHKRKDRPYRVRKAGLKEKFIDRQILAIHRAIVDKLLTQPERKDQVLEKIEALREQGRLRHGAYLTWYCLVENMQDEQQFRAGVLEESAYMNKLRRNTPLVGIISEEERQQALMDDACGDTSIETIL